MQALYYFWPDYLHDRKVTSVIARITADSPATVAARLSPLLCAAFTACAVLGWLCHDLRHTGAALESNLLCIAAATFASAAAITAAGLVLMVLLMSGAVAVEGSARWIADSLITLTTLLGLLMHAGVWWRRLATPA